MGFVQMGFLATKKGGADLHGAGAEHERRGRGTAANMNAAAEVRPSATPSAAITGSRTASTTCGKSENSPGCMLMSTPVKDLWLSLQQQREVLGTDVTDFAHRFGHSTQTVAVLDLYMCRITVLASGE
jgi:hypothetical protein